jgi:hypothetical protein
MNKSQNMNKNINNDINENIDDILKKIDECKIEDEEEVEVILEKPETKEEKTGKKFVPFNYQSFKPQPLSTINQRTSNLYSKFCENIVKEGMCKHSSCTFAHTVEQYSPLKCKFNCQNRKCSFYHSWENIEEYIKRNNIYVHEHIRMQSVIESAKFIMSRDMQKKKENTHTAQINLICPLSQVSNEVTKLNKLGYNNINLKIKENTKTKILVDNLDHYLSFLNENIHNFTLEKLDSFLSKERYRLFFILNAESTFYIRNLVINKEEQFLNKNILGELSGLELINKIHEYVSNKIKNKYNLREIVLVEEKSGIIIDVVVDEF